MDGAKADNAVIESFDDHIYETGDSKDYLSQKNELSGQGAKTRTLELYLRNSTPEYRALELATGETAIAGKPEEVEALGKALVQASLQEIDAAAKVDLATLLAIVNTQPSLDRLVDLLRDENPVVQHAAAEAFEDYRWPNAAPELWLLANSSGLFVQRAATVGLQMCATDREAELLKEKLLGSATKAEDLRRLARLLIQVSPAVAETLLKDPKTPEKVRSALIELTAG